MPRPCSIPQDDLSALVAAGGGTWRHTALCAALVRIYGCDERTARRAVRQALASGVLANPGGWYQSTDRNADPAPANRQRPSHRPSPATRNSPPTGSDGRVDRHRMLRLLQDGEHRYSRVISILCDEFGCCPSTARANLNHALAYGYMEHAPDGYRLTAEGITGLETFGRLEGPSGVMFARFCAGRPGLARRSG
jgi:hypothetical protein